MLLELDAFRGVHLDPNAHHWDDVDDEDDNFLDDVVEFGDGTQYTVAHNDEPADAPEEPPSTHDYDRSWPQKSGGPVPPHQMQSQRLPPPAPRHSFQHSTSPIADSHLHGRGPSSSHLPTKPRAGEDPSRVLFNERTSRFETPGPGRGPPTGPAGGSGMAGPGGMQRRRPSNDRPPPGRGSLGFDRPPPPHVELQRHLPPHLEGRQGPPPSQSSAAVHIPQPAPPPSRPAWGLARDGSRGAPAAPPATSPTAVLKDFPPPSAAGAARAPLPPQSNAFAGAGALPPPARSARLGSFSKAPDPVVSRAGGPSVSPEVATQSLPHPSLSVRRTSTGLAAPVVAPKEDVTLMQKDEMHSAAERARLRRQKEEEERMAAVERARAKAKELEERFKPKVEEKKAEPAPVAAVPTAPATEAAPPKTAAPSAPPSGPAARPSGPVLPPPPPKTILVAPRNLDRPPATPVRAQAVQKWKLEGNLLPSAGLPTPPPPRLNKGEPIPDDVQVVDFSDLGSLMSASTPASAPQPPPATKSRRPVATDFFGPSPSSPSRPTLPPAPKLPTPVVKIPSPAAVSPEPSHGLPARPAPNESTVAPAPSTASSPAIDRAGPSAPPSPSKSTHRPVQASQFDDAMARIKGLMKHEAGSPSSPVGSGPSSPVKQTAGPPPPARRPVPTEPEGPHTKPDRPSSPVGWKVYTVKLPPSVVTKRGPVDGRQLRSFFKPDGVKWTDPLSWEPPLGRHLKERLANRDETLHSRKVNRDGSLAPPSVSLPSRKEWVRLRKAGVARAARAQRTPQPSPPPSKLATPQQSPTPTPTPKAAASTPTPSPPSRPPAPTQPSLSAADVPSAPAPAIPAPAPVLSAPSIEQASPTVSLPVRPVPALEVVPPTPHRPVRAGRAMEEQSWRRRVIAPEATPALVEGQTKPDASPQEPAKTEQVQATNSVPQVVVSRTRVSLLSSVQVLSGSLCSC